MYVVQKVLSRYSFLGLGADVLDIAGAVVASKEIKYHSVSDYNTSTSFQMQLHSLLEPNTSFTFCFPQVGFDPSTQKKQWYQYVQIVIYMHNCKGWWPVCFV